jgi:RND family efflux transporter MFP subunit
VRRGLAALGLAALGLVAALAACSDRRRADPDRRPPPRPGSGERDRGSAQPDEEGFVGVLVPRDAREITSPLTTKIQKLLVKLGEAVEAGTQLAILDDREPREQLTLARSELREGAAAVRQAIIEREAARAKLARDQAALRAGIVSVAEAEISAAEAAKAATAVERVSADVEKRGELVKQLEQRLADTTLRSPIAGKVALRYVEEGARVQAGQAVIRVIRSDELFVKFAIPAADARRLAAGDPIELRLPERRLVLSGVVKHVAPELDPIAQMVLAEAEVEDRRGELRAGDTGRVVALRRPAAPSPAPAPK